MIESNNKQPIRMPRSWANAESTKYRACTRARFSFENLFLDEEMIKADKDNHNWGDHTE